MSNVHIHAHLFIIEFERFIRIMRSCFKWRGQNYFKKIVDVIVSPTTITSQIWVMSKSFFLEGKIVRGFFRKTQFQFSQFANGRKFRRIFIYTKNKMVLWRNCDWISLISNLKKYFRLSRMSSQQMLDKLKYYQYFKYKTENPVVFCYWIMFVQISSRSF